MRVAARNRRSCSASFGFIPITVRNVPWPKPGAESYQPAIDAHLNAAESYERAQLVAEIGIVIASLAVLLTNRVAWLISIALAIVCVIMLAITFLKTRTAIERTSETIVRSEHAYHELRKAHLAANEDERTAEQLDPGGKIRAAIQAETSADRR